MFERFTHEARQIVAEAQAQARGLRHNYIGTEHLVLAILRHGRTPAASILTEIGVGLEPARARVATIVRPGEEESVEQIPFTPRAKQVLEIALREWMSAGNAQVTPEPLVLGLLRQCDGVAQRVIRELASDLDDLRARLVEQLPPRGQAGPQVAPPPRAVLAGQEMPPAVADPGFSVTYSAQLRRLLMRAGARALDDGRTEISVADVEAAMHRQPPQAAAG